MAAHRPFVGQLEQKAEEIEELAVMVSCTTVKYCTAHSPLLPRE